MKIKYRLQNWRRQFFVTAKEHEESLNAREQFARASERFELRKDWEALTRAEEKVIKLAAGMVEAKVDFDRHQGLYKTNFVISCFIFGTYVKDRVLTDCFRRVVQQLEILEAERLGRDGKPMNRPL